MNNTTPIYKQNKSFVSFPPKSDFIDHELLARQKRNMTKDVNPYFPPPNNNKLNKMMSRNEKELENNEKQSPVQPLMYNKIDPNLYNTIISL